MGKFLLISVIYLSVLIIFSLVRVYKGPSNFDRLIGISVINSKVSVIFIICSFLLNESFFVDVAIIYSLLSFMGTIFITHFAKGS